MTAPDWRTDLSPIFIARISALMDALPALPDTVEPTPAGVALTWTHDGKLLEVEVNEGQPLTYLYVAHGITLEDTVSEATLGQFVREVLA